ncbi:Crp/Fnr family transcriptional regulator [Galbibacter sp.]|uniref:Crp/Fnr family transcriptional regulator n=1 Tax=Galbibacter sp. TaxID=2918471 RepID=UPI003A91085F
MRFYIANQTSDLTLSIAFNNGFVSGYNSFLTRSPSSCYIETLIKTVFWQLTFEGLQEIYRQTKIGNAIGRYASEDLVLKKSQRELCLLHETAQERYLNLVAEQLQLLKEIPLKYIASYIGVTPQALSRIRKRIS